MAFAIHGTFARLGRGAAPFVVVGAAVLPFLVALEGQVLTWDDGKYLSDSAIQGTRPFFERLGWIVSSFYFSNYNPLHRIGYWVQLSSWGLDPRGFHAVSIAFHAANALLAHAVARRLGVARPAALAVAAVFALHPTRAEVVAWISAQKDLGATLFTLIAVWIHAPISTGEARPTAGRLALAGAAFGAALLWKSAVLVVPLLLVALDVAWGRPLGRSLLEKAPFLLASALFAVLTLGAGARPGPIDESWTTHAATALQAPSFYVRRLFWPWGFSARWWVPRPGSLLSPGPIVGLAVAATAAVALAAAARRPRARKAAVLAIAWPVLCLLPVLNLVPIPIVVADRYLYLAILGPVLAAALAWQGMGPTLPSLARRGAGWGAAFLAVAMALSVRESCRAYRDSETIWRVSLAAQPENPAVRLQLASTLLHLRGDREAAAEVVTLLDAPAGWTERQQYRVTRAKGLEILGRTEEATREIEAALDRARTEGLRFETAVAAARRLVRRGDHAGAHRILEACPAADRPVEEILARAHLEVCMDAGDDAGYLRWSEKLLSWDPFDVDLWYGRHVAASRLGATDAARRSAERLSRLVPGWRSRVGQGRPSD